MKCPYTVEKLTVITVRFNALGKTKIVRNNGRLTKQGIRNTRVRLVAGPNCNFISLDQA